MHLNTHTTRIENKEMHLPVIHIVQSFYYKALTIHFLLMEFSKK